MRRVEDVIEDIQQAQVDAGGRFMKRKEIEDMRVVDILKLLIPNGVEFNVSHKPKQVDSTELTETQQFVIDELKKRFVEGTRIQVTPENRLVVNSNVILGCLVPKLWSITYYISISDYFSMIISQLPNIQTK